jgi:hypothetical protein
MGSSAKHKTTMAKLNRERALRERRELKQAKKDARRRAAAETAAPERVVEHEDDAVAPEARS